MTRILRRCTWHVVLVAICVALLFPVYWALISSFKPTSELYGAAPLPVPAGLDHYQVAVRDFPIVSLLLNTLITAGGVTLGQLVIAVLAGYALVRFRFRGRAMVLALTTVALLIPHQVLIVPQFLLAARLGWLDTYAGLIVPQLGASALPVLLLRQHVQAIPPSLVAAAQLDGAGACETLWHVVLPLLRPAMAAVSILVFINTWNEYLWPMLVAPAPENTTIQMGLALFTNQEGANHGPLLASAVLATVPVLAVYLFAARRITDAFMHSGLR